MLHKRITLKGVVYMAVAEQEPKSCVLCAGEDDEFALCYPLRDAAATATGKRASRVCSDNGIIFKPVVRRPAKIAIGQL